MSSGGLLTSTMLNTTGLELSGEVAEKLKGKVLDTVIIGGGPAGLSAAMYAARFGLSTVVITEEIGGQVGKAGWVEDYLGYVRITGPDLVNKFEEHVRYYNVPILIDSVERITISNDLFKVTTVSGDEFTSRTVIIAVGERRRKLNVPGEDKYSGKGVSYCAPCDAPLFKDKVVAVVGGGDSAASSALLLTEYATKVYLIHRRSSLRAQPIYQDLLLKNSKITIIWNTVVKELKGDKVLKSAILQRTDTGELMELPIDGIFIEIGAEPPVEFFKVIGLDLDKNGYINVNTMMETNIKGIYAAGDCVSLTPRGFRQIITAAAQGALAAYSAYNYILTKYGQNREK
ncbi:thioredoxin-disulfide reductase [Caldivirga maquilingensis]|uniref:Thioredoxin reductase n=1 Tax=Caldivirga maquilingensis (strain ATCC 700844 / DSM 13496 / JCM 10307 / IC-167) TaxID=397948 RepID=A8MAM4_CALMQ|nr:thioredoxin-disulfide reductase [Caldivirga maquilingensis]ABW01060.1 thioredoxin reductase [Caldivirga maquilingensis IC-167]